jgi:hypothetical protein
MGRVWVHGAKMDGERIGALEVRLGSLPPRTIDRDTALAWARDGHSFVPLSAGQASRALQLVEVDEAWFLRDDHESVAADALPPGLAR